MRSCELGGVFDDGLFGVNFPIAYTKMFTLPRLFIMLVASSDIPVVALPAPTRVASSAARLVYHYRKHDIAGQTGSSFSMPFVTAFSWGAPG
jgi:hypothetical protein